MLLRDVVTSDKEIPLETKVNICIILVAFFHTAVEKQVHRATAFELIFPILIFNDT